MVGLLSGFNLWRDRRTSIRNAVSGDEGALHSFLERHPDQRERIVSIAQEKIRSTEPWSGLALALGLAQGHHHEAMELFRLLGLRARDANHWKIFRYRVSGRTAHTFLTFVSDNGGEHEAEEAGRLLSSRQIAVHLEALAEHMGTTTPDVMLELLRPFLKGSGGLHSWEGLDGATADALTRFILEHGQEDDLEALFARLNTSQALRGALLASRRPRLDFLPVLRKLWWIYEEDVQNDFDHLAEKEVDSHLVAFVDAIAVALGACAACDTSYRNFEIDDEHEAELREIYEKHQSDIVEHNRLVDSYRSIGLANGGNLEFPEQQNLAEYIKNLREVIRLSEFNIRNQESKYHDKMSPGFILRRVLFNAQRYPIAVRQGAVFGLYKLLTQGHLDRATREQVFDTISRVVCDRNSENFGERHIQLPHDANLSDLTMALRDGLCWMVEIMEGIVEQWQTQWRTHLEPGAAIGGEDRSCRGETHCAAPAEGVAKKLLDGKRGFGERKEVSHERNGEEDEEEGEGGKEGRGGSQSEGTPAQRLAIFERVLSNGGLDASTRYPLLEEIAALLFETMPQSLRFLQRYPLRLMRLDYHRNLLGQYSKVGCHVTLWTRYSPPKEIGPVHFRYLSLNDRTQPNSMGIYYDLFRHPVLALPVVYHEYLHYGGYEGEPSGGIDNETEVLIKEILFARHLVARLAPARESEIPAYEELIAKEIHAAHLDSLMAQLLCDLEDDAVLGLLNRTILSVYGEQKSSAEADQLADLEIGKTNVWIHLENATQTWQPDVPWPMVGQPGTETLAGNYRRLLKSRFMIDHSISKDCRNQILAHPVSTDLHETWQAYRKRPQALQTLAAMRDRNLIRNLDLPGLVRLIVLRFSADPEAGSTRNGC